MVLNIVDGGVLKSLGIGTEAGGSPSLGEGQICLVQASLGPAPQSLLLSLPSASHEGLDLRQPLHAGCCADEDDALLLKGPAGGKK